MSKPQSIARSLSTSFANAGIAALTLIWLAACGGVSDKTPSGEFVAPVVEWQIVFEDNFDGAALDASQWNIDEGDGCPENCGWGNNELQTYDTANISVVGGVLSIEGRQELDGSYTSGRLNTAGKFDFQYGRVEVSARIPAGQGIWPAIWLLHSPAGGINPAQADVGIYGPWPLSGEIDIMEAFNFGVGGDQTTQSTTHYGLPIEPFNGTSSRTDLPVNANLQFHEYAIEWEKDKVRFFVDGQHYQTQNSDNWFTYYPANEQGLYDPFGPYTLGLEDAPFDQAFHLLINFAIGGNPVGSPDPGTTFPQTLDIEYVRIYECANANPGTGRGCGMADASVVPLEDHDGGPLAGAVTAQPFIESLDLFLDAPEVITLTVGADTGSNALLAVIGFAGGGATVTNDPAFADPDDAANTVWHVAVAGDVANVLLTGEDLTSDPLLDTGFDFSGSGLGGDPVGEIAFDMYVNSVTPGTNLLVKLDSGFPNLGEVVLPESELAIGAWKTYSVKFRDLLASPGFVECCGGTGVDLANVINPFVFEVAGGDADVYLDNIRINNACYVVGACNATPRTKGIPDVVVFDDAVNVAVWDTGIAGADSGSGFVNYTDGTNPANKANWAIIADADPARGEVIDVTFNDSGEFGVWFIQSTGAVDMNAYAAGALQFDIIVDDYGNNINGMTMKVDCFFPCTSGDKSLGVIADGVWETITVPVVSLTGSGLDLNAVNTGIVVFPTSQSGTIRFRLDNIRWVASSDAIPLAQIDLPVTFDAPLTDYTLLDFEGTGTVLVEDPDNSANTVASTTKGPGGMDFAGTIVGTPAGFATPIPFAPGATTLSMRVRAPAPGIAVTLQVENAANDDAVRRQVAAFTTQTDAWETLSFDFSTVGIDTSVDFVRAVLFFDLGTVGGGETYLWDDLAFGDGPTLAQVDLPVTFDDAGVDYEFNDFGDPVAVMTTIVADPDNVANRVASTTKPLGTPFWAGTTVGEPNGLATRIPLTATDTIMTLRVYSPDAGIPVRLKVESKIDVDVSVETEALTTMVNTWETLTFDFSNEALGTAPFNPASTYDKPSVFFNFGTDGDTAGEKTYLWDDLAFVASAPTEPFRVFDDTANVVWDIGLAGTESPSFPLITDGTAGAVVNWSVVAAADANRGQVIEATFFDSTAAGEFGLFFIQSSVPVDMSGFAGGSVVFDIFVSDYGTNTNGMIMKVDCGFPCTSGDQPIGVVGDGAWETVSIPVAQLVGAGADLNLATVNTGIVIFPDIPDQVAGASVTFQIDNVRWEPEVLTDQAVFGDAVDAAWDVGIAGTESPGFPLITDGTAGAVVNWSTVAAADVSRGQVIEATIGGAAGQFGLMFIQSSGPIDLSAYDEGAVVFDIFVSDYGTNTNGMIMKIDCGFPCTSGDQPIGVVGNGDWQTVSIEVSQLVGTGLDLTTVNTGIVIYPDIADQEAGASVTFQIDNAHWEP